MKERLSDLSASGIAFRVAAFGAGLGFLGRFLPGMDGLLGFVLLLASAALFYEAWIRRWSKRRLRNNLIWGGLSLAAAMVLLSGYLAIWSTSLFALGAVCAALGVVALLGERE